MNLSLSEQSDLLPTCYSTKDPSKVLECKGGFFHSVIQMFLLRICDFMLCWFQLGQSSFLPLLCLGYRMRMVLVTYWCLGFLVFLFILNQGHFFFFDSCSTSEVVSRRNQERTHLRQVTGTNQKGIPYHRTPCPVFKLGTVTWKGLIWVQAGRSGISQ